MATRQDFVNLILAHHHGLFLAAGELCMDQREKIINYYFDLYNRGDDLSQSGPYLMDEIFGTTTTPPTLEETYSKIIGDTFYGMCRRAWLRRMTEAQMEALMAVFSDVSIGSVNNQFLITVCDGLSFYCHTLRQEWWAEQQAMQSEGDCIC